MNSALAMSRLDAPANTWVKISRSRGVKPSEPGVGMASIPPRRATSAISAASGAAPSCSAKVAAEDSSAAAARRSPAASSASATRRLAYASGYGCRRERQRSRTPAHSLVSKDGLLAPRRRVLGAGLRRPGIDLAAPNHVRSRRT